MDKLIETKNLKDAIWQIEFAEKVLLGLHELSHRSCMMNSYQDRAFSKFNRETERQDKKRMESDNVR